jgi:hypothetical protein
VNSQYYQEEESSESESEPEIEIYYCKKVNPKTKNNSKSIY